MSGNATAVLRFGAVAMFAHHLDHLLPLCELLGATLLTLDVETARIARECYPHEKIVDIPAVGASMEERAASPAFRDAIANFDVFLCSHLIPRELLRNLVANQKREPPRVIFCPHGFSEKSQTWSAGAAYQDISLFYGELGLKQLEAWGVRKELQRFALIGNLRLQYWRRHASFFARVLDSRGVRRGNAETVVLYAPTWRDNVGSSSFQDAVTPLINSLPANWKLIIKPHPLLEAEAKACLESNMVNRPNVTFLERTPVTYPVLAISDIYIGDMSALAYDFLVFDRPMVFLNQTAGTPTDVSASQLFECGPVLSPDEYPNLGEAITLAAHNNKAWSSKRRSLCEGVYCSPKAPAVLRDELLQICEGPAPQWMQAKYPREVIA